KYAFLGFMPNRNWIFPNCNLFVPDYESSTIPVNPDLKELPSINRWKVISDMDNERSPNFLYKFNFNNQRRWDRAQAPPGSFMVATRKNNAMPLFISGNLLNEIFTRETESCIYLIMDFNDTLCSIVDYVQSKIFGMYDSVSIRDEFSNQHALSMKCFRRFAEDNQYGGYAWVIAFDRYYYGNKIYGKEPSISYPSRKIRYFLVLNSCKSDKQKAEEQFMSMINAFVAG
ncbi:MAG: hypothetical protein ABIA63_09045, partial [bacterium]